MKCVGQMLEIYMRNNWGEMHCIQHVACVKLKCSCAVQNTSAEKPLNLFDAKKKSEIGDLKKKEKREN